MPGDGLRAMTFRAEQLKVVGVVDVFVDRPADVVDLVPGAAADTAETFVPVKYLLA
jgi:hypothetical protein